MSFNQQYMELSGYRVQERIGIGGMGEVYKAFHPGLNRVAAIKILYQKDLAERFRNEAYIQSSVSHPNIARLYEYSFSGERPCIIMEYVEGTNLDDYIQRKGRLGNEETERILLQITSALSYLHKKDIVHRDLKPQNFKIQRDGTVKMLDFGIAKNRYTPRLTQQGFVVGTTEYMAPEQFQNDPQKKSDIWSLGVMTYEMLTGHLPFEENNQFSLRNKILKASFTDPRLLVPQISPRLTIVIDRSLKVNPSSRITAQQIESVLAGGMAGEGKKDFSKQWEMLRQNWMYLAGALVLATLFLLIVVSKKTEEKPVQVEETQVPAPDVIDHPTRLTIKVPSIPEAVVVLADGSRHATPYQLTGKEGDKVSFTIEAEGYQRKEVSGVEFTPRRSTYEYNLEKKN